MLEGEHEAYCANYKEMELQRLQAVRDDAREAEKTKAMGGKGKGAKGKAAAPTSKVKAAKRLVKPRGKPVVEEEGEEEEEEVEEE